MSDIICFCFFPPIHLSSVLVYPNFANASFQDMFVSNVISLSLSLENTLNNSVILPLFVACLKERRSKENEHMGFL